MFLSFCVLDDFFRFSKKNWFLGILGPPYCGIGATIRIGREMLCLPYAGFFFYNLVMSINWSVLLEISAKGHLFFSSCWSCNVLFKNLWGSLFFY